MTFKEKCDSQLDNLFEDLYHPNPNINRKAYTEMSRYWPEESLPKLLDNLSNEDVAIRRVSVKALGLFGERIFQPLQALFHQTESLTVQVSCLKALVQVAVNNKGVIFPLSIMKMIELALENENPEMILTVVPLLRQIGKGGLPLLIKASRDKNILKATSAITALGEINEPSALATLRELIDSNPSEKLMITSLNQALSSKDLTG